MIFAKIIVCEATLSGLKYLPQENLIQIFSFSNKINYFFISVDLIFFFGLTIQICLIFNLLENLKVYRYNQ